MALIIMAHSILASLFLGFLCGALKRAFVGLAVRCFLCGKSLNSLWFFYQMRYPLTLGNSGVFFGMAPGRCRFLGCYEVFRAD
jgi:hypothetical protein